MRRLCIMHPHTTIKLYEGVDSEVTAWVLAGVIEVGITSQMHPDLNFRTVYEDDFTIVLPSSHALATKTSIGLKDLDGERMLISGSNCRTLIENQLAAAASSPEIICSVHDNTTLVSMVREGLGLTVLPELALPANRDGLHLVRLHPTLRYTIYALTKRQKIFEPAAMTFLGVVQSS